MKSFFLLAFSLLITLLTNAQNFGLDGLAHLRDSLGGGDMLVVKSIKTDAVGNIYVGGTFKKNADFDPSANELMHSTGLSPKIFIAKYDATGTIIWAKAIGKIENHDISAMDVDPLGNVYITGIFRDRFFFDPDDKSKYLSGIYMGAFANGWATSGYIVKYNPNGELIWANKITSSYELIPNDIHISASDIVTVTGSVEGTGYFETDFNSDTLTSAGTKDMFVARYTGNGHFLWANRIGGAQNDVGLKVSADEDDNLYIIARIKGLVDVDPGVGVFNIQESSTSLNENGNLLLKLDNVGNFEWCNFYEDLNGYAQPINLTVNSSNKAVVTGIYKNTSIGNYDFDFGPGIAVLNPGPGPAKDFTIMYDEQGAFQWVESTGMYQSSGVSVVTDVNDTVFVTGLTNNASQNDSQGFIAKYGPNGGALYVHSITSTDAIFQRDICLTPDGVPITTGQYGGTVDFDASANDFPLTEYSPTNGLMNAGICRFDTQGFPVWAMRLSDNKYYGNWYDYASRLEVDNMGNVIIRGVYRGATDFDPGSGQQILPSEPQFSQQHAFIAKYDSIFQHLWSFQLDSVDLSRDALTIDQGGNIYAGILLYGTANLNPLGTPVFFSPQNSVGTVAKYTPSGMLEWNIPFQPLAPSSSAHPDEIEIDNDGNLIVMGVFGGTIDFDPGPGVYSLTATNAGFYSGYIAKYDADGNLMWVVLAPAYDVHDFEVNETNEIFITGKMMGSLDLDPGPGTTIIQGQGVTNILLAKHDEMGGLIWAFALGDTMQNEGVKLAVGADHVYLIGEFDLTCDFDPGPGVHQLSPLSSVSSVFLARYTSDAGELDWVFHYDSVSTSPISIDIDDQENLILLGEFRHSLSPFEFLPTIDFDPINDTIAFSAVETAYDVTTPDLFLAMYDSSGSYIWASQITGQGWLGGDIKFNATDDQFIVTGGFEYVSDFAPRNAETIIETTNGTDIFIASYSVCFPTFSNISATECNEYTLGGHVYTTSGIYTDTISNYRGCDSIVTLNLTILPDNVYSNTVEACGSYTWDNGQTYHSTGFYAQMLTNQFGCDSTQFLNLTIHPIDTTETSVHACVSYVWDNGQTYTASGEYYRTITASSGCDSVLKLNLTISQPPAAVDLTYDGTGIMAWGNPGTTYQWIDCSSFQAIQGETSWYFIPESAGAYATIYSNGICSDTADCFFVDFVEVGEYGLHAINGFPNPVTDSYTIDFNNTVEFAVVELTDLNGRVLFQESYKDVTQIKIPINLASGTYLLRLFDECCLLGLERIVVQD